VYLFFIIVVLSSVSFYLEGMPSFEISNLPERYIIR